MSRSSNYVEECDDCFASGRYEGVLTSALRGRRGQQLLRDMVEALDALPRKELVEGILQSSIGGVCALGAVGLKRGVDLSELDPDDTSALAEVFDIASALVSEIIYLNDEWIFPEDANERWRRMRNWAAQRIQVPGRKVRR